MAKFGVVMDLGGLHVIEIELPELDEPPGRSPYGTSPKLPNFKKKPKVDTIKLCPLEVLMHQYPYDVLELAPGPCSDMLKWSEWSLQVQ